MHTAKHLIALSQQSCNLKQNHVLLLCSVGVKVFCSKRRVFAIGSLRPACAQGIAFVEFKTPQAAAKALNGCGNELQGMCSAVAEFVERRSTGPRVCSTEA